MKKLLFTLGGCLLLALLLLPSALASKSSGAKKKTPPDGAKSAPAAPRRAAGPQFSVVSSPPRTLPARPAQNTANITTATEPIRPAAFRGDVRDLPQVPSSPHVEMRLREPPSARPLPSGPVSSGPLSNVALASAPAPNRNFAGLSADDNLVDAQGRIVTAGAGGPPDANGDVGLNHYIESVNSAWAIYSKTGERLAAFTENTLWATAGGTTPCNGHNGGDWIVIYDQFTDHWILTNLASFTDDNGNKVAPFYQCFAVSMTGDPVSGGWWLYAFQTDTGAFNQPAIGLLNDYPKFGNWNDGCLYMSANEYPPPYEGVLPVGVLFASFNKSDMENGAPISAAMGFFNDPNDPPFTLLPSNISGARDSASLPPPGTPNYFVSQSHTKFVFEVRKFTPGARCGGGGILSDAG